MSVLNISFTRVFSLIRKGGYSLASQGVNSATNFLTGILLGRFCSKEEYGLYALGFTIVILFNDFQTAFISTPYMVYSPRFNGDEKREFTGSALIQQLAFSALASIMLVSGLYVVTAGIGPAGLSKILKVLIVFAIFILLKEFIRQMSFATLNTRGAFIVDLSASLIQISGLTVLAITGVLSAGHAYIAIGIACSITVVWWLVANKDRFILRLKKALPDFRRNWAFVKWVVASHILWVSAMSVYPWLIAALLGVEANGVWAACLSIIMIGNLICVAIQNMLGPEIVHAQARGGVSGLRNTVFRSAFIFSLFTIGICLVIIAVGNFLVVLLYGEKYDGQGTVVSILAANLVAQSATYPFSRGLFAMERTDIDFFVNMAVSLSLILGVWLIIEYDLVGAALGMLTANSLSTLLRGISFAKVTTAGDSTNKAVAGKKAGLS